ncbi:hypothetical protein GLU64_02265 [Nanohaloarchaea archaeon]|nr:hypothetical protein [Candidatus Nanohaloarchaea archaeon]
MNLDHFVPNKHNLILTTIFTVVFLVLSLLATPLVSLLVSGEVVLEPTAEMFGNPLFGVLNLLFTIVILYLLASLSLWYHEDQKEE